MGPACPANEAVAPPEVEQPRRAREVADAAGARPLDDRRGIQHAEAAGAHAPCHVRSESKLPPEAAALASPQAQALGRKGWSSTERPVAMFSAASTGDLHRDLSKGLTKLLSFVFFFQSFQIFFFSKIFIQMFITNFVSKIFSV